MIAGWLHAPAHAASGEDIYKTKCSSCHDSGAGQAPRVSVREDWHARETRGRNAMQESAIKGIPATAMAAKGGYAELTDDDVRRAVDYMLARVGFRDPVRAPQTVRAPAAVAGTNPLAAALDDVTLATRVAEAIKKALAPNARIELYDGEATVRGLTIKVGARDGLVTLSGAVEKADVIPRALAVAQSVAGARQVESRLITAGMLDFD